MNDRHDLKTHKINCNKACIPQYKYYSTAGIILPVLCIPNYISLALQSAYSTLMLTQAAFGAVVSGKWYGINFVCAMF